MAETKNQAYMKKINSTLPDLTIRYTGPELMDDLNQDTIYLYKTLRDFSLINKYLSNSFNLLKKYVFEDLMNRKCKETTLLDIGSGGGDTALWFVKHARKLGIKTKIFCLDYDQRCIDYSRKRSKLYPEVHFLKMSVDELDSIAFVPDYIYSNHLFHHLEDQKIPEILKQINAIALRGFLVNDLRRSALSYFLFSLLRPLFGDSSYTWRDGLLSIRKAFFKFEMENFVKKAGLSESVKCSVMPPGRIVITNLHR